MQKPHSAASIEIEIQALLSHYQASDLAADALIKKYEDKKLSLGEFEALATFLLYCGFYATLTDLITRKLNDGSHIPWGHFVEALFLSTEEVSTPLLEAVLEGAKEARHFSHLARSHYLDGLIPEMNQQREKRRKTFQVRAEKRKTELLREMEVLKSQGLHQEEEKIIQLLITLFPEDSELYQLKAELRERLAQEYMSRQSFQPRHEIFFPQFEKKSEEEEIQLQEIENAMMEAAQSAQELATDFALSHIIWDNHEAALRILDQAPEGPAKDWLRAEALLRGRRFVELLNELLILEEKYADDAETVFSVHYLRAQALWGLKQKFQAIEILEGMVETRPTYRSAASLLQLWKEDFA